MFCLSFILNRINPKAIILYITTLVFLFFAIFLTNTRAIWIALLFSLLVFFVKKPRIIIVSSVLIGLFMFLFSDIILSRFLTIKYFGSDLSSLGRLQAWIATTALLKNNLLTGYWFDAFMDLRDNVYTIYLVPVIHSHNTYLRSLLEMGLIGSVLYYSFFFRALYFSIKLRNSENSNTVNGLLDGIQLSIISLLIVFIFEPYLSLFGCSTIIIWLIISFTFKLKYYINAERELNNISC
ncbi:MAG: O-antigen ligase family protein [Ignavibacteriae bacterium]|nr:O-antigen ligase family protein [Ignavibacteriota bacterium]